MKKITQNLDSPAQNCFIICPWIETQREDTHFCLIKNTFYHFKWKASSKTSNYWMFCYDRNRLENSFGAFYQNDVRIWSLLKILVHCLSNWLIIELHFPVTTAVGYGVVKIDASNYWMFLHPIVGCTSNANFCPFLLTICFSSYFKETLFPPSHWYFVSNQ